MTHASETQRQRESSFGFLIQSFARKIDGCMKAELQTVDIDIKLFANLRALAAEDGINQRELGKRLNFPEYFTSRNIDAMVDAGFAERRADPNSRRSFLIFLTDEGRKKAEQLPPIIDRVNSEMLQELSDEERVAIIDLLQKASGI